MNKDKIYGKYDFFYNEENDICTECFNEKKQCNCDFIYKKQKEYEKMIEEMEKDKIKNGVI